jgi:hypothetical protein
MAGQLAKGGFQNALQRIADPFIIGVSVFRHHDPWPTRK